MAKQNKYNLVMTGASGNIGDQLVFRQVNGRTVLSKVPFLSTKEPSAKQIAVKEAFIAAAAHASSVVLDPGVKAAYVAKSASGQSAYTMAMSDFYAVPEVSTINTVYYNGMMGDHIYIKLKGIDVVKNIKVTIVDATGFEVERGIPVEDPDGTKWIYTAKQDNLSLVGTKIKVEAVNYADKTAIAEVIKEA